jgi:hypothetical protein
MADKARFAETIDWREFWKWRNIANHKMLFLGCDGLFESQSRPSHLGDTPIIWRNLTPKKANELSGHAVW